VAVTDDPQHSAHRPRIAVFAGPTATVLNTEPLVTSNEPRLRHGVAPRTNPDGRAVRFDSLRPQRLAAPVTVYVEQFSAHPLERDAAGLYGPPDGFVDTMGAFHRERTGPHDVPVYEVELRPEDRLYPLPYAARQADGRAWEGDEADPFGPRERARQPFYPDASRLFEEIDRLQIGEDGLAGQLDRLADYDYYRAAPPGGSMEAGERPGDDFFPYRPPHLRRQPSRPVLARLTNVVAEAMAKGHEGGLWLEGTPFVEETAYWLGLLIDTTRPLAATASQRRHGGLGNDGDRNVLDAITYLVSRGWADDEGRDAMGAVVVVDQLIIAARSVQKADARPGGYVATGGHGGILGSVTAGGEVSISWRPTRRATWRSAVRLSQLPEVVQAATRLADGRAGATRVVVRSKDGALEGSAVPAVEILKQAQYREPDASIDPHREVAVTALMERELAAGRLAGFVAEGATPYGSMSESMDGALRLAVCAGLPVVKTGRGNADGVGEHRYNPLAITGGNLSASKARLLLMACLLRFGSLPAAADPEVPTPEELRVIRHALDAYQEVFDSH
jgi:L-asparaginase